MVGAPVVSWASFTDLDETIGYDQLETGIYGRILARDGVAFAHDDAGRRTLDDRFAYRWGWRDELLEVEVLDEWPDGVVTPWAGHKVEYRYDASGRLAERWLWGREPEEGHLDGSGQRPYRRAVTPELLKETLMRLEAR